MRLIHQVLCLPITTFLHQWDTYFLNSALFRSYTLKNDSMIEVTTNFFVRDEKNLSLAIKSILNIKFINHLIKEIFFSKKKLSVS